jgi:transposase
MNYQWFIGVDVSKQTLDLTVLQNSEKKLYQQITNSEQSIKSFLKRLVKEESVILEQAIFCMEHTGIYNAHFLKVVEEKALRVCVESSVHIKQSGGLLRGKNDKIDSYRIALYAFKNKEFLITWKPERTVIKQLRRLSGIRERLINAKKQLTSAIKEDKRFITKQSNSQMIRCCKQSIASLQLDIQRTEEEIEQVINTDARLKELFAIIESVPGVGKITATEIVINTNEFKRINNPRKYACYSGVAPFEHTSGTSVRGKTRTTKKANLKAKSLLHMSALVAARFSEDLRTYYERKVAEGKNKMNVLNAVKNKLIHRIFACVAQNRLYQKNYQYCLVES